MAGDALLARERNGGLASSGSRELLVNPSPPPPDRDPPALLLAGQAGGRLIFVLKFLPGWCVDAWTFCSRRRT